MAGGPSTFASMRDGSRHDIQVDVGWGDRVWIRMLVIEMLDAVPYSAMTSPSRSGTWLVFRDQEI
jgi:hypothetical protein